MTAAPASSWEHVTKPPYIPCSSGAAMYPYLMHAHLQLSLSRLSHASHGCCMPGLG